MKNRRLLKIALAAMAATAAAAQDTFRYSLGEATVTLLSERQQAGNKSILIGATPDILAKTAPDGTFPNAVNAFLIQFAGQTMLADTGFGTKLFDNLAALGVTPEQIDAVLLTHMHGDHIGGLLRDGKPAFPNAKIILSTSERDHWMAAAAPDTPQKKVLAAYSENLRLITPNTLDEVANDKHRQREKPPSGTITSTVIAAPGHTPGHIMFQIEAGEKRLLIWGDLTHAMAVQMPYPNVAVTYDVDPAQAVQSRLAVLEYVAKNRIPIAGMHIPYPGIGTVAKKADGYRFTPAQPEPR